MTGKLELPVALAGFQTLSVKQSATKDISKASAPIRFTKSENALTLLADANDCGLLDADGSPVPGVDDLTILAVVERSRRTPAVFTQRRLSVRQTSEEDYTRQSGVAGISPLGERDDWSESGGDRGEDDRSESRQSKTFESEHLDDGRGEHRDGAVGVVRLLLEQSRSGPDRLSSRQWSSVVEAHMHLTCSWTTRADAGMVFNSTQRRKDAVVCMDDSIKTVLAEAEFCEDGLLPLSADGNEPW